jgi:hypothetical protein
MIISGFRESDRLLGPYRILGWFRIADNTLRNGLRNSTGVVKTEIRCHPAHMAAARFAAVLLLVLAATLTAQNTSTGQVVINVVDPIGAVIPGAQVEIDPLSPSFRTVKTDANGQAVIELPIGTHWLSVSASGFQRWKGFAEVQRTDERITAKLRVAKDDGLVVHYGDPVLIPLQRIELRELIPLQPLELLPMREVSVGRKHRWD